MIKATIYVNKDHEYQGFDICDHAEYADPGFDVVCSAVSMLVINTLNSIEAFTDDETSLLDNETEGSIQFRFKTKPSHDAELLIKAMLLGLESMEDNSEYEPYIDIIFKEV